MKMTQSSKDKAFVEKIKTIGFTGLTRIGHKATSADVFALDKTGGNSELAAIAKDKVIFKNITEGNASDKKLNKDVEAIVKDFHAKNDWRPKKRAEIEKRKEFHRKKWGKNSIQ